MAFFQLILNARKLRNARLIYHDEKIKSIEVSKGSKVHYTFRQKIRYKKILFKKKLKEFCQKITTCPEDSWFHEKAVLLRTDGTLENYLLKSIFGFLGGIFLTYILFMFFIFQLNFTLTSATIWCSLLGIILTLGLAFSSNVRCIVFLLMPQFFSKRGRQALMAYAFILALTGPAKNTLHNIGVLSESLACGEEQLKEAIKAIIDLVKEPFYALKEAITKMIKTVKVVVRKMKRALIAIKKLVLSILKVIHSVFEWLGSIVNICNKKLGTPFERCNGAFQDAVTDCKAKLGSFFGKICNVTYLIGTVCYIVKPFDFICVLVTFVSDAIVGTVRKKIKKFTKHMKAMFYVKVKFSHSFHFESNQSRTMSDVSKGISTEIRLRTEKFLMIFDLMSFITSFFILFLLLRVIHYRHKWLTNTRFDNRYLTNYFREIDIRRAKLDKETVLPLNPRERNKYIPLSSITLIKVEKVHLAKSAVLLSLISCELLFHMASDYSLYWVLSMIRFHGRVETKVQQPNFIGVQVSGTGYLAELYRSIVKAFSPSAIEEELDTVPCLPDPVPPDFDKYLQITSLIILSLIMTIFEPYGLRLRQVVMSSYHPDRAKERAVWLYNHILRSRGSFLKFARRQLRRKFGIEGAENMEKVTFREKLTAICPFLNVLFPLKQNTCLLCGAIEREGQLPHIKCPTPGCIGIFCVQCFADLQNLCTVCKTPMDYGDLSDISEEKDSSEEDLIKIKKSSLEEEISEITGELYEIEEGTQVKEEDIDEISSSTEYSYSYQDDGTQVYKHPPQKEPYKDIEAQKLRDDVTTQIFSCSIDDMDSGSESPTCFGLRARRRLRSRFEKMKINDSDEDKLISAQAVISPSSEEIEEEELINIKLDNSSDELLPLRCEEKKLKKKKRGRIKKFFDRLLKFFWFKKKKRGEKTMKVCKKKGQKYDEIVTKCPCTSSSFSSSMSSILSYNLDYQNTDREFEYPHEKCFPTKKLPRGLVPVAKETRYFEVDETEIYSSEFNYDKQGLNILSDVKTSSDTSRITEIWNICEDDEYYNYQSFRSDENDDTKNSASSLMTTIEEDSQETSRSKNNDDDYSESSFDSKQYIDVTGLSSDSSIENQIYPETKNSDNLDEIEEKSTSTANKNDTSLKEIFFEDSEKPKVLKNEKSEISLETQKEKMYFQKETIERRLNRRRYDENYYSSSDNENYKKPSTIKRRVQDDESKKKSKRRCKHYFKKDKSCGRRKRHSRILRQSGPGFGPIIYYNREQDSETYDQQDSSDSGERNLSKNPNDRRKTNTSCSQCPINQKKNILNQRPELIEELEGDDRMKLIRKKEDERQSRYDVLRCIREQGTKEKNDFRIHLESSQIISTSKRGNTLPYQETKAFQNLVEEYKQKAFAKENKCNLEDENDEEIELSSFYPEDASFVDQLENEST